MDLMFPCPLPVVQHLSAQKLQRPTVRKTPVPVSIHTAALHAQQELQMTADTTATTKVLQQDVAHLPIVKSPMTIRMLTQ